ncbi:MAG: autotransporter outer membrane beta-barrel domain-containing protein [Alphaproteobacteria bacterium]|nr:autotransporter outer membrane beta-barrel domain-containing protein [Alphaproteobacteria bacterium]
MLKFLFVFIIPFGLALSFNVQPAQAACNPSTPSNGSITISNCNWDSSDPFEYTDTNYTGNLNFNIVSVSGDIAEIGGIKGQPSISSNYSHNVVITSSSLNIGKLFNDVASVGSLELRNSSTITFNGEGLQTDIVKLTLSKLILDGTSQDNKINQNLEMDDKSSLVVDKGATLNAALLTDKEIKGNLEVLNGSSFILNYNDTSIDPNDPEKSTPFKIASLKLDGKDSTLIKDGNGEVVIAKFMLQSPAGEDFKIVVNDGILNVGAVGNQYDKSNNSFTINGGQLKYSSGDFKANVANGGEIYFSSKEASSKLEINSNTAANPNPTPEGTLITDGKNLNLFNTNLDKLIVKSGNVVINTQNSSETKNTNITNLIIEGGNVASGTLSNNGAYFENIEISNGGQFYYDTNDFSNLNSLKLSKKGEFIFRGSKALTLDGVEGMGNANDENGGIITINSSASGLLTLKNSHIQLINLTAYNKNGEDILNIDNSNTIGELSINLTGNNSMAIDGSFINQVSMIRSGTLNIEGNAEINTLIINSAFTPKINIKGGAIIENVALNNSGTVEIDGNATIKNLNLIGSEKVNIGGGSIDSFTIGSKSNRAEVIMNGGYIGTFRLEQAIEKLELLDTEIDTYEIALDTDDKKDPQVFDFTQEKVSNLIINGKRSIVNIGVISDKPDNSKIPHLETIVLDQGTLNYNFDRDNFIQSITTTQDHPLYPQEDCSTAEDEKKCNEENAKKPIFDTEFNINAGDATLTANDIKLENINLQSGYVQVNNNFESERKLTIAINGDQKIEDANSRSKITVDGDVKLGGELNVEFKDTYDFLLGKDNQFALIEYAGVLDKSTEFKFLTNLSYWFDKKEILCENGKCNYTDGSNNNEPFYINIPNNGLLVGINRRLLYTAVVEQNGGGTSGGIYEMAQLLDTMITYNRALNNDIPAFDCDTQGAGAFPCHMAKIITGLDTRSADGNALIINISKLMPVSHRVYANSIHTNNQKNIDTLSSELRDFTNLEDNLWVKLNQTIARLGDNKDVIGYTENSNTMQLGYSKIISSKAIAGASVSYLTGTLDGAHSNFNEDFITLNAAVGIDYLFTPKIYGKTVFNYSQTQFDNTRNLNFIKQSNTSKLGSSSYTSHIESGYISTLDERFYNFNATYSTFYSLGSIAINSYSEEGVAGKLNVDGASILVHDLGIGTTFDKEILYVKEGISLKPTFALAAGIRYYSGTETNFKFQEIDSNKFRITNGSYLPIFVKYKMGIDYIAPWANISVSYRFETDANKYNDSSFYLSFKHSF